MMVKPNSSTQTAMVLPLGACHRSDAEGILQGCAEEQFPKRIETLRDLPGVMLDVVPPSAKAKTAARPQTLRRFVSATSQRKLSPQKHLDCRFAGITPSDFDSQGIFVYAAFKLNPPSGFEAVWQNIDSIDTQDYLSMEQANILQNKAAILLMGDPNDDEQVRSICATATMLDKMSGGCPALFWAPHSVTPGGDQYPDTSVYDRVLNYGVDDVIPGEPKGLMLTVTVRSRLAKLSSLSNKVDSIITQRRDLNARAYRIEASLKQIVWDYLRQRLQTGLPGQEPGCPPGIPSRIDGLVVGPPMGKGASGEVFTLVIPGQGPSGQVVKCVPKADQTHIGGLKNIKHQLKIMQLMTDTFPHPNIVKFNQVYHIETHILFRMENGGNLNLFKRLKLREDKKSPRPLSVQKVVTLVKQTILALEHLHSCNVAHRDMKPENICVQETAHGIVAKLTDWDVAVQCAPGEVANNVCGTFPFTAPEVYLQNHYSPFSADIWSLGVMHAEIMCGVHLLDRLLELSDQRERFEQDSRYRRGKLDVKTYLTQKIHNHFLKEGTASHMIDEWARNELQVVAAPLRSLFDVMVTIVSKRSTAKELLQQFEKAMHSASPQEQPPSSEESDVARN